MANTLYVAAHIGPKLRDAITCYAEFRGMTINLAGVELIDFSVSDGDIGMHAPGVCACIGNVKDARPELFNGALEEEGRRKHLGMRVTPELLEMIDAFTHRRRIPRSQALEELIARLIFPALLGVAQPFIESTLLVE